MKRFNAFGSKNFGGKLEELLSQFDDFRDDDTSEIKANSLAISCWSLEEWAFKDPTISFTYRDRHSYRNALFEKCPSLAILHDIATSAKHNEVSRPKATIKNNGTNLVGGAFSNGFSRGFDISRLEIELEDDSILDYYDEVEKVVEFWKDFFKAHSGQLS
jgi:hypothetical protein